MKTALIAEDSRVGDVVADELTAPFLEAALRGVFLIKRGPSGRALEPLAITCPDTGSIDLVWEPASGRARLLSWTVIATGQPDSTPQIMALAELEEGPWWWALVDNADPTRLVPGLNLEIVFRRSPGGLHAIPIFALATHDEPDDAQTAG